MLYSSGVFDASSGCSTENHAITIVGYGMFRCVILAGSMIENWLQGLIQQANCHTGTLKTVGERIGGKKAS
jgi:hypothetical protein